MWGTWARNIRQPSVCMSCIYLLVMRRICLKGWGLDFTMMGVHGELQPRMYTVPFVILVRERTYLPAAVTPHCIRL